MSQLLVRNLLPSIKEILRVRAMQHGVSMEAEARDILCKELMRKEATNTLSQQVTRLFGRTGFVKGEGIAELKGHAIQPVSFE